MFYSAKHAMKKLCCSFLYDICTKGHKCKHLFYISQFQAYNLISMRIFDVINFPVTTRWLSILLLPFLREMRKK